MHAFTFQVVDVTVETRCPPLNCVPILELFFRPTLQVDDIRFVHALRKAEGSMRLSCGNFRVLNLPSLKGFTLIELLIVIAITAIVAALVTAASFKVMDMGKSAKCLSNLRQIGAAMHNYMSDNQGYAPPHQQEAFFDNSSGKSSWQWMTYLAPYVGSPDYTGTMSPLFTCPSDPKVKTWPASRTYLRQGAVQESNSLCSYGYNFLALSSNKNLIVGRAPASPPVYNIMLIPNLRSLVMVTDGRERGANDGDLVNCLLSPYDKRAWPSLRHANAYNAVFVDGHVEAMSSNTLSVKELMKKHWLIPSAPWN